MGCGRYTYGADEGGPVVSKENLITSEGAEPYVVDTQHEEQDSLWTERLLALPSLRGLHDGVSGPVVGAGNHSAPQVQLGQNPGIPPSSHGSTVGPPKPIGIRNYCGGGRWEEHALWGLEGLGWCCSSTMTCCVALGIPSISQGLGYLICGDASSP